MNEAPVAFARVPDATSNPYLRERPGVWLTFAGSALLQLYGERLRPLELRPNWVVALAIIADRPGITQSALARALTINRASSMALATRMEASGFISRLAARGRQRTVLELTPTGHARLEAACGIEDELVVDVMGWLDEGGRRQLVEVLMQIVANVNARPAAMPTLQDP